MISTSVLSPAKIFVLGGLTILLMSTGCGPRLAFFQEITLGSNDIQSVVLDPISREQVVTITANSNGPPFHIHVYLLQDEQAVDDAMALGTISDKVISGESNTNEVTLEALIPANEEAAIRLQPAGRDGVTVNLTVTNY